MLRDRIIRILQFTVLALLIGRAWQHLFWEAPYEYFFQSELGFTPWFVLQLTRFMGWFFAFGILATLLMDNRSHKLGYGFVICSAALLFLAYMYRASHACELPILFEHSSQIAAPLLYYLALFTRIQLTRIVFYLKIALSLTLGAYAWYSMGWNFGQPNDWLEATKNYLSLSEDTASAVLFGIGVVEVLIAVLLWVRPLQKIALAGVVFWGSLLVIASVAIHLQNYPEYPGWLRSFWEILCLIPNFGLSYAIWRYVRGKKMEEDF